MHNSDTKTPDETPDHRRLKTRDAARDAIASLFQQAQRQLSIFGPQLDAYYFNTARIEELIGIFIARHHDNHIRILVEDSRQALLDNARLKQLAHRLPDCLRIRQVGENHRGLRDVFVVADHNGYFHQPNMERFESLVSQHAPRETVQLARRFQQMWEESEPAQGLGTLGL
jgi:hypothetical protein